MSTTGQSSGGIVLSCITCGVQQPFALEPGQTDELIRNGELRLYCPNCRALTSWYGGQPDRRSGRDRRTSRHTRIQLPIQVRCTAPGHTFTEVTQTLTASRQGASFMSRHLMRENMVVYVTVPYREGESDVFEMRARVAWVEAREDGLEVGVEFTL